MVEWYLLLLGPPRDVGLPHTVEPTTHNDDGQTPDHRWCVLGVDAVMCGGMEGAADEVAREGQLGLT